MNWKLLEDVGLLIKRLMLKRMTSDQIHRLRQECTCQATSPACEDAQNGPAAGSEHKDSYASVTPNDEMF